MKKKPVVTLIGAAGITFGPKVLRDLIHHPELEGITMRFMDIDEDHLAILDRLARMLLAQTGLQVNIESTTDRAASLAGADYVLISVDTARWDTWKDDYRVPRQFGIRQVTGELGGPGGLFHSLRQIPLHLEIGRDIERICPDAMVMVESNPLNRICLALRRYTKVGQVVGLCHGVEIVQFYFSRLLGIDVDDMVATAAGTNHFTWILDLRLKETGEDLYPAVREKLRERDPKWEPLSRKLFGVYGYYPSPGDSHIGEYIPYAYEFLDQGDDFLDKAADDTAKRWQHLDRISRGEKAEAGDYLETQTGEQEELRLKQFFSPRDWTDTLAFPIFSAIYTNKTRVMPAVNLLNEGTIANLPADVFVEVPTLVNSSGLHPVGIGDLPKPLAAFCRRDIDQMELTVEAAVTGDRNLVLQAMLLDPVVDSVSAAEKALDELLEVHAKELPQFA